LKIKEKNLTVQELEKIVTRAVQQNRYKQYNKQVHNDDQRRKAMVNQLLEDFGFTGNLSVETFVKQALQHMDKTKPDQKKKIYDEMVTHLISKPVDSKPAGNSVASRYKILNDFNDFLNHVIKRHGKPQTNKNKTHGKQSSDKDKPQTDQNKPDSKKQSSDKDKPDSKKQSSDKDKPHGKQQQQQQQQQQRKRKQLHDEYYNDHFPQSDPFSNG
jgi:hypothetical protein